MDYDSTPLERMNSKQIRDELKRRRDTDPDFAERITGIEANNAKIEPAKILLRGEAETYAQAVRIADGELELEMENTNYSNLPETTGNAATVKASAGDAGILAAIAAALDGKIKTGLDQEAVISLIDERLRALIVPTTVRLEKVETGEFKDLGLQHKEFPKLLRAAQARLPDGHVPNIYLHGEHGTGKTTAAQEVAKALELPFYFNGAIDTEYKLSGFVDAAGQFQSRPFYEAYKNGGVYLFDELDSSMPSAVLAFNAALANGHADFPTGSVERHKDCIIIGAGNTTLRGDGHNKGYQRTEMDAAFADRFGAFIPWEIDNALEDALVPSEYKSWLNTVRKVRANVELHGIKKAAVSPRATFNGMAFLNVGFSMEEVIDMTLRKGLPEENWKLASEGI